MDMLMKCLFVPKEMVEKYNTVLEYNVTLNIMPCLNIRHARVSTTH